MPIPSDFESRLQLWVRASHQLAYRDDPWLIVDLQQLGITERLLLEFERMVLEGERQNPRSGDSSLAVTATLAHSRLWLLGFYEVLRTYRQRAEKADFARLSVVFRHLELARMPLAKHEPQGLKNEIFYPRLLLRRDMGWVGWEVFDPKTKKPLEVFRTALANEFLTAMETAP